MMNLTSVVQEALLYWKIWMEEYENALFTGGYSHD